MIVVEAGHVMKFLPLSCELSIFVIFQVKSAVMGVLFIFFLNKRLNPKMLHCFATNSKNIELFCTQFNSCV
jgi:ribosome-associated toxin RatA of RatAB toxin-antitoxin module